MTRDIGMIHTGTAWRHSASVLRASSRRRPTCLPVPLPIFLCRSQPAVERLLLLETGALDLREPRELLDVLRGDLVQLLAHRRELALQRVEVGLADGVEHLLQLPVLPRRLDVARQLAPWRAPAYGHATPPPNWGRRSPTAAADRDGRRGSAAGR